MARRSDHTREELVALAITETRSAISEKGLGGMSTRGIATKMGYTVGTLYHVFGSLDGLMLHANAVTLDMWFEELTARAAAAPPHESVAAIAQGYVAFALAHKNLFLALFEYHLAPETSVPAWYQAKMDRFFALVETEVAKHRTQDITTTARLLWSGIHGIAMLAVQDKLDITTQTDLEPLVTAMVSRLLA